MSRKNWIYAQAEGISQLADEFDNDLVITGTRVLSASFPGLPDIDLLDKLGPHRIIDYSAIDEKWYCGAALGSALIGIRAIHDHNQSMAEAYPLHLVSQHAAKLHHMTGGQATIPCVFKIALSGQAPGMAGQHSDYESDSWYAHIPGVKTVIPSTVYDAKGLLIAAVRSGDPIVYFDYGRFRALIEEAPDEAYEVPIGKAALRSEGSDITIVGSGGSMPPIMSATERLQQEGVSVEAIDLRSLHPIDTETLVKSAEKTGKVLTVDQSKYTLGPGAEVIARIAEGVPGTHFRRIAYPDAPPPGAPEMFNWMTPNADHVYDAAARLLSA